MTDLEISRQLALAIGWEEDQLVQYEAHLVIYKRRHFAKRFDYRDWNVIGPIAERYELLVDFEQCQVCAGESIKGDWISADTPQKAIALAVIGAKK